MSRWELTIQPWLFQVEPYAGESFGHYLGRFRRVNVLSRSQLSVLLGVGYATVSYWEAPSRRRIPEGEEKQRLAKVLGIEIERLNAMWLPKGVPLHLPTRLCAHCYDTVPCHQVIWQSANTSHCVLHQRRLLSACPRCQGVFRLPCYWWDGQCEQCEQCGLPFTEMGQFE